MQRIWLGVVFFMLPSAWSASAYTATFLSMDSMYAYSDHDKLTPQWVGYTRLYFNPAIAWKGEGGGQCKSYCNSKYG